jgi:hypothetical protein
MKPKIRKHRAAKASHHHRPAKAPKAPVDSVVTQAFRDVEPPGFQDNPYSSVDAAIADPDVEDTEGGE